MMAYCDAYMRHWVSIKLKKERSGNTVRKLDGNIWNSILNENINKNLVKVSWTHIYMVIYGLFLNGVAISRRRIFIAI